MMVKMRRRNPVPRTARQPDTNRAAVALKADPLQLRRDIFFVPLGSRPLPIRFERRLLLENWEAAKARSIPLTPQIIAPIPMHWACS